MRKFCLVVLGFFYTVTGLRFIVEAVRTYVFNYKLRLRFVPVTFKLFLWTLGMVSGMTGMYLYTASPLLLGGETIIIENSRVIEKAKAQEVETPKVDRVKELSELIYQRESTSGKKNYSKCDAIGKVNGIGYAIPGNGSYICFDNHEDEMATLKGWIISKMAAGMSEKALLCLYSGNNYIECKQ